MYNIYTKSPRASQIKNIFEGLEIILSEISSVKDRRKSIFMFDINDQNTKCIFVPKSSSAVYSNLNLQ